MLYDDVREKFEKACEEVLTGFEQVGHRNDIYQYEGELTITQVKQIMDKADLKWQPGFGEIPDSDGDWFVEPSTEPEDGGCGMCLSKDGNIYMNMY